MVANEVFHSSYITTEVKMSGPCHHYTSAPGALQSSYTTLESCLAARHPCWHHVDSHLKPDFSRMRSGVGAPYSARSLIRKFHETTKHYRIMLGTTNQHIACFRSVCCRDFRATNLRRASTVNSRSIVSRSCFIQSIAFFSSNILQKSL